MFNFNAVTQVAELKLSYFFAIQVLLKINKHTLYVFNISQLSLSFFGR